MNEIELDPTESMFRKHLALTSSEKLQNWGEEKSELWCCLYFGMESCDAADPVDGVNVSDPKCVCGIQLNWINLI